MGTTGHPSSPLPVPILPAIRLWLATIIFVAFPLLRLWLVFWVGWAPTPGRDLVGVCSGRPLALSPSALAAVPEGIRVDGLFHLLLLLRFAFRLPGSRFLSILAPFSFAAALLLRVRGGAGLIGRPPLSRISLLWRASGRHHSFVVPFRRGLTKRVHRCGPCRLSPLRFGWLPRLVLLWTVLSVQLVHFWTLLVGRCLASPDSFLPPNEMLFPLDPTRGSPVNPVPFSGIELN